MATLAAGCASIPAEMVLVDATVYTGRKGALADAIAISDGHITAVGTKADLLQRVDRQARVVSMPGTMVLPGFIDSHVHPVTGGVELGQCDLNEQGSLDGIESTISRCASEDSGAWLVGGGWDLTLFEDAHPKAAQLDALVPERPAYLSAADNHSAWVNTAALQVAGIDADTPDPPGGRIERDASGVPTGTLRESAMALVEQHLPETTDAQRRQGLRRALAMAHGFGITSVQEANATPEILAAYVDLAEQGALTARVVVAQHIDPEQGPEQLDALAALRDGITVDPAWLRATSIKIFADGVIESGTAALLEPYEGSESRGELRMSPERLVALVEAADRIGFDIHIHAIGDRGIRVSLDAFEAAIDHNPARDRRHMLAHVQLIDPTDLPRFATLGVIANVQALWAYPDPYITEMTEPVLGPERSRWLYPFRSLFASGALVVGGSDWSVSSMNPLRAIEVATTRHAIGGTGPAWIPQESVELEPMLAANTVAGAYANRREAIVGTLEVGKRADLVVLERNLLETPKSEIHAVGVQATLVEGRVVHGALEAG